MDRSTQYSKWIYAAAVSDLELAEMVDFDSEVRRRPNDSNNNYAVTRPTTSDFVRNYAVAELPLAMDEFRDAFCHDADADHTSDL